MPDIATWLAQLDQLAANPGDIQSLALNQLSDTLGGTTDIADPTNPLIQLMEISAVNTAGAMTAYETYTRRQYGNMAQIPSDLYVHMSDVDYLNRFAIPSSAQFFLLFAADELYAAMVPTGVNGISQLTIPRFTNITVNETTFTMQYPILIRQLAHGGLQVVFDNTVLSPIETLETNIVTWDVIQLLDNSGQPVSYVRLWLNMDQFAIQSQIVKINYASGLSKTYTYPDQFYYVRAYSIDNNGNATEILTTHTDQNFDPATPTLLVQDLFGSLQVSLPQIYLTNRAVGGEIQVDIYTTKGDLSLALDIYEPNAFVVNYEGASLADTPFVAPLTTFSTMSLYSQTTTSGGSDGMTFAELRDQVLTNNFGPVVQPITPTMLSSALTTIGYQPVIDVDIVTDRIVLATRALPPPTSGITTAGANMSVETLVAAFTDLTPAQTVVNNGDRITVLPTTLFSLDNGILSLVPDSVVAGLKAMPADAMVRSINAANYLYTPFHYVLDATDNLFALRPYYLDAPLINSIQFVDQNETVGVSVATGDKEIVRTADGYRLRLQCQSSAAWKALPDSAVYCQLAFIPEGEKTYAYLNGTLISTQAVPGSATGAMERIFEFDLGTNYDVDANDCLVLSTFQMYDDAARLHATTLTGNFEVFWAATGIANSSTSTTQIDLDMGTQILPAGILGVTRERINQTLGVAMEGLWHRSRTVAGSGDYQVYATDVMDTYTQTIYQRDPVTGNVVITYNPDGTIGFTILHRQGDPVLDPVSGNPVVLHKAGDRVLDLVTGQPIVISSGTLQRQMDMLMVEGVYYFTTETDAAAAALSIPQTLVTWVTQDLATISSKLLENTQLYFYPKATLGDVDVLVQAGKVITIQAAQTFNVLFYLDETAWRDPTIQAPLTQAAVSVIAAALQNKSVSLMNITSTLQLAVSNDVAGFDIDGLGGPANLSTMTVIDDSQRLSIRKLAVVEADGTVGVEDGVNVTFVLHDVTASLNSSTGTSLS